MPAKVIAIIPARYQSSRLEAKLLKDLGGQSVLERTYKQVLQAQHISQVIIATDDQRIIDHCNTFNATVFLTDSKHQSGTDRIAELAKANPQWQIIINVQGDEPFINPDDIDKAIEPFLHDPLMQMTSLYHLISAPEEIENPNNVKVVTDINSDALYFSRSVIPFDRDQNANLNYKKHIGLYAYRRDVLLQIAALEISELEKSEKLEQLRALANGIKIKMLEVASAPIGIDTAEDLDKARRMV